MREGFQGVHWVVLPVKPLKVPLPTMDSTCEEAHLQMALQKELEKGVASLSVTSLHASTALRHHNIHLLAPTVMLEEICLEGTMIGTLAIDVSLSSLHSVTTKVLLEAEALQGTETGEAEVGAFHVAQLIIVIVTETVVTGIAVVKSCKES